MDIFILDSLLRRVQVVDQYESFIWTERYDAWGDFQIDIRSNRQTRQLFSVGTWLSIRQSKRVMVVETVEDSTNSDGAEMLKIVGRSLEKSLEDRVNRRTMDPGVWTPEARTPGDLARHLFDYFCRDNVSIPQDNLPYLMPGTFVPPGTILEPDELIQIGFEQMSVYESVQKVCQMFHLGFRLLRKGDMPELYFDVYTGRDRTSGQYINAPVIFSKELDNLTDSSALTSIAGAKNVAYVFAKNGGGIVYAEDVNPELPGFERQILTVKADNIDLPVGAALDAAIQQRGREELAKWRPIVAFDGEISQNGAHIYGIHYDLGDLVEMRNADSLATNMRVTEQIFVSDAEGERSYPTLTIDLLITPGSWLAWDGNQVWQDADGTWAEA